MTPEQELLVLVAKRLLRKPNDYGPIHNMTMQDALEDNERIEKLIGILEGRLTVPFNSSGTEHSRAKDYLDF